MMSENELREWNKPTAEKMDNLIKLLHTSEQAYWCKWCNRHIPPDAETVKEGGLLFIHDDVYHPSNCSFDSGDVHRIN
jgi:hypothetical protein